MLEIKGYRSSCKGCVEIDYYLPLRFRTSDKQHTVPLYWRLGDFKNTLIEIGLDVSGSPCSVNFTLLPKLVTSEISSQSEVPKVIEGLPTCDISVWNVTDYASHFFDERIEFFAYLNANELSVWIPSETAIEVIYRCDRIGFGRSRENKLSLIRVYDLTFQEQSTLIESVGTM